jgi:hypothetical protein
MKSLIAVPRHVMKHVIPGHHIAQVLEDDTPVSFTTTLCEELKLLDKGIDSYSRHILVIFQSTILLGWHKTRKRLEP